MCFYIRSKKLLKQDIKNTFYCFIHYKHDIIMIPRKKISIIIHYRITIVFFFFFTHLYWSWNNSLGVFNLLSHVTTLPSPPTNMTDNFALTMLVRKIQY